MGKWDGLKKGEWVETGRQGRDGYGDGEMRYSAQCSYNTITYECLHLILNCEYKCSSNDLTIINERCTCRRKNKNKNTKKCTCDLNVHIEHVQDPKQLPAFPEELVCHGGQTPSGGQSLGESPSMLMSMETLRVTPAATARC